jgi:hypothetical protein
MKRRLIILGLIFLISVPLSFLLRGFTREVFLANIMRLSWLAHLYLDSLPQPILWTLFLLIAVLIAVLSLIKRTGSPKVTTEVEEPSWGRIHSLLQAIYHTSQGIYFKWRLAQYLLNLSIEALAHRERTTPERIKQRLMSRTLDVPSDIEAYLLTGLTPVFTVHTNLIERIKRTFGLTSRFSPLDLDPERVVQFLEDQLEIEYES